VASPSETRVVYGAGLVQGVALVAFPASSAILTSSQYYDLSSTAYGALFLPQAVAAIMAALSGASLIRRVGIKRSFVAGLVGDVIAMSLLVASQFFIGQGAIPYAMLLLATTSLGVGFGLTVPAINTFAAAFAPSAPARAVLYLNALLGLGTALAPVLVAVFVGIGFWWGLPLLTAILIAGLIAFGLGLPLEVPGTSDAGTTRAGLPARFWVFAIFALLYGLVETTNGNWATLYMTNDLGATVTLASLALTTFWAMVTVGRILFAAIERQFPETRTYRLLPFVAAAAMGLIAILPGGEATLGLLAFGLAGLGCSALLPLTISFGQAELVAIGASVAGLLIAFYQMGYGLAAFGIGPLQELVGLSLSTIYAAAAVVAVVMGILSFTVVRGPKPASA
jgi:fucose permease